MVLNGDSARYTLGIGCAIGDLNNDGYSDLVVRGVHQTTPRYDYLDIWFGGGSFDTTKDVRLFGSEILARGLACFDANADGISDLLWTCRDSSLADWVCIHYGATNFPIVPSVRLRNPGVANFGNAIIDAGDMSGDGNIEIAVAASQATITSGFVFIFEGGSRLTGQYAAAVGMSSDSDFGRGLASIGDVTGDGLADIIIGAPTYEFGNNRGYWGVFKGDSTLTSVSLSGTIPSALALYQAYPNPFNPSTTIRYDIRATATITLDVFDLNGRHVATLAEGSRFPVSYQASFDGSQLASGIYFYRLTATLANGNTFSNTKKLTLIR